MLVQHLPYYQSFRKKLQDLNLVYLSIPIKANKGKLKTKPPQDKTRGDSNFVQHGSPWLTLQKLPLAL